MGQGKGSPFRFQGQGKGSHGYWVAAGLGVKKNRPHGWKGILGIGHQGSQTSSPLPCPQSPPVHVPELDTWNRVELVLLEVGLLEWV